MHKHASSTRKPFEPQVATAGTSPASARQVPSTHNQAIPTGGLQAEAGQSEANTSAGAEMAGHQLSNIAIFPGGPTVGETALGGLLPGVTSEDKHVLLGGNTIGETIGDIARPVGTAVGNVVGSIAGALTGIDISSTTNTGPTWGNNGQFEWVVGFTTTGQSGWIVQEIVNTYRAEDAAGQPLATQQPTPNYWEAWAVDASSTISPSNGANHDYWLRPDVGNNTQGHWSMTGKVYFTTTDPSNSGLTPSGVTDAGILLSGTSAPADLGIARLHRYAQGSWDSTGATPTHTGSAGP